MTTTQSTKVDKGGLFPTKLLNQTTQDIQCWTSNPNADTNNSNFFTVKPSQTSPDGVDVDHFKDLNGQWWKCGEDITSTRIVIIEPSGNVVNAECKVSNFGQPCGQ